MKIETNGWGYEPEISIDNIVTVNGEAFDDALQRAFGAGVNAVFQDLSLQIMDGKLVITAPQCDPYAEVPLSDIPVIPMQGEIPEKDLILVTDYWSLD